MECGEISEVDIDGFSRVANWPLFRDHFARPVAYDCVYDGGWPAVE